MHCLGLRIRRASSNESLRSARGVVAADESGESVAGESVADQSVAGESVADQSVTDESVGAERRRCRQRRTTRDIVAD